MEVGVAGQGYVGLPLAVRAAETEMGHRVVGYDVGLHRIKQLTAGESHVEDVTSSRLRAVLGSGAYSADADAIEGFDIAVITVPTPLRDGVPDLTYVEAGFSPERIAPGNKRWSFEGTPKLVSGIDATSLDMFKSFYDDIFSTVPVAGTRAWRAALTKAAVSNASRYDITATATGRQLRELTLRVTC